MRTIFRIVTLVCLLLGPVSAQQSPARKAVAKSGPLADSRFKDVDAIINEAIALKGIPGAVLVVGHNGQIVYRKAYGKRSLEPTVEPMTLDTIFDCASLTKVVATTPSVMQLLEQGKFRLNDPISKYIPEFGHKGKEDITIRQLMVHYSGLRPDVDLKDPWSGKMTLFNIIAENEKQAGPAGAQFVYSDINYEMLGFLVEKLSGETLEHYTKKHVFTPLGMKDTGFLPDEKLKPRIAPTEYDNGVMLRGVVHDPTARRMGGVAGHAGMFSTAADLTKFAMALMRGGRPILSKLSVEKMSTPQQPPNMTNLRGLGWDIDTPFSSNRGELIPIGSFGHTGFTGTSLWMDPYTNSFVVLLTNAVHPRGDVAGAPKINIRTRVANAVAAALNLQITPAQKRKLYGFTGYNEAMVGYKRVAPRNAKVLNGIDVLEASNFTELKGKREVTRVGVLTNHTGLDATGQRTIDVLAKAPGIKLAAIFAPEHGTLGKLDVNSIGDEVDQATGVKVTSVYGTTKESRHPPQDVLKDLDAVVVDLQDIGARYWTYMTAMLYAMESAAQADKEIYILDRPNPVTGTYVQGPISDIEHSYVNFHPVPVRHGMTMGELAKLMNTERKINAKLTVIQMQGWQRGDWFDSINQMWVSPSPNMRNLNAATLYTGVAIVEGTNVSVGRGTDHPFEVLGAPWITDARAFAEYVNKRSIAGVRVVPTQFTPEKGSKFGEEKCSGVFIFVTDRQQLDAPVLGIELASALIKLYPKDYKPEKMINLLGNKATNQMLLAGRDPRFIADQWRDDLDKFNELREKYLLYK